MSQSINSSMRIMDLAGWDSDIKSSCSISSKSHDPRIRGLNYIPIFTYIYTHLYI
jgi:hypothetical protein